MKTRKQHYVWRNYLRSWSEKEQIWCLRNSKIFKTNLMNIANERDFYIVSNLTQIDIDFLKKLFLTGSNLNTKKLNQNWINIFEYVLNYRQKKTETGIDKSVLKEYEKHIENFEENIQSTVENSSAKYFALLEKNNIEFYKEESSNTEFNFFLALQYLRTNRIKSNILKVAKNHPKYNIDNIWNISLLLLATNFGETLSRKIGIFNLILLLNETETPFITSDQPVINLYADYKNSESGKRETEKLELYYPLSPKKAILITEKTGTIEKIDKTKVNNFNAKICEASEQQIYADSEEVLKLYI